MCGSESGNRTSGAGNLERSLAGYERGVVAPTGGFLAGGSLGSLGSLMDEVVSAGAAAALAGVEVQPLRRACSSGRLPATQKIAQSGRHANRPYWEIRLADLFQAYPAARTRWEAQQAVQALEARKTELETARQSARAKVLADGPLGGSDVAAARAWHCLRFERFQQETGETRQKQALMGYVQAFERGELGELPAVARPVTKLSDATLMRWLKARREGGNAALEPQYKTTVVSRLDAHPELGQFALGMMLEKPDLAYATIHEMLVAQCAQKGWDPPSPSAVNRYLNRWKEENPEQWLLRNNPDAYQSKLRPAQGSRSEDVTAPNELWEADATKVDLIFSDSPRRHSLCAMVDVYTDRRKFYLVEQAGARDQVHLLKLSILEWGLPTRLKTDNGKDYTAKDVQAALATLQIDQVLCQPFRGDQKPHVERGFRTFLHDLVVLLPGFCGHNVAHAQAIRARKTFAERLYKKGQDDNPFEAGVTKAEFEAFMHRWLEGDLHRVRTKSSRIAGQTPQQRIDEWTADGLNLLRRVTDPTLLDFLLMPAIPKAVQKKGIKHLGKWFVFMAAIPVGAEVQIRELEDMGRISLWQGDLYLGQAECPELTGISRQDVAVAQAVHHKVRTKRLHESSKALRQLPGVNARGAVDALLDHRIAQAPPSERLQRIEAVATVGMAEAARAIADEQLAQARVQARRQAPDVVQLTPEQIASSEAWMAQEEPLEDAFDRYWRLRNIPPAELSPSDYAFLKNYYTRREDAELPEAEAFWAYHNRHQQAQ